jgi:predicted HAD superfamily phosphohydrolase
MNDVKKGKDNPENSTNASGSFILIDEPIDLPIQEEYVCFSETMDFDNVDYEEVLTESDKLFDKHTPIELKKRILILLAHLGTAESCRILEKYLKISEGNLRDWALLSLKECRAFLESVLL